jgi:hypothetical protein
MTTTGSLVFLVELVYLVWMVSSSLEDFLSIEFAE